jgi:hypothetical protein
MLAVRRLSVSVLLAALFSACDNPDPLAPSLSASKGGPTVAAPSNLTASADSYHQIWLAWQDNATNESGFDVYRSTTGPTGSFILFTTYPWPNTNAGGNDGLQASTQYCYKVRAFTTQGQSGKVRAYSDFSNTACATTLAPPVFAAPTDVSAAPALGGTAIRATWTDHTGNETGFRVERSATSNGPWTTLGTTWPNFVEFIDRQPPAMEQPACYRVFALNGTIESAASNVDCTAVPAAPAGLVARTTISDVDLTWTDNSAVEDGFLVTRWTPQSSSIVVATLPANATGYRDQGLPDGTYYYRVLATKDGGESAPSDFASARVVTMPPIAPAGADAVPSSSSSIVVMWTDGSTNEDGFRVDRSSDGGATWVTVAELGPDQSITEDLGLPSELQLCYRVIAFNYLGESPPSNTDCATPPAAPSNFAATPVDAVTIDFAWTDNSAVEDGYAIGTYYVDYDGYLYWWFVASVGPNVTSYRCQSSCYYYNPYFVVALKDGGYSYWSNEVTPTPSGAAVVRAAVTPGSSTPSGPRVRLRNRP